MEATFRAPRSRYKSIFTIHKIEGTHTFMPDSTIYIILVIVMLIFIIIYDHGISTNFRPRIL